MRIVLHEPKNTEHGRMESKRKVSAQRSRRSAGGMLAALFLGAGLSFAIAPNEAHAEFRVCNTTQNLVGVAIGYRSKDGWVSEGWWQIPASGCATLIEGQLQSRYYYLYAEDAARGGRWAGNVNMCVAENEFKITGVQDCFARGFQQFGFKEYDTGRQGSWMVQLTDMPAPQESQN
ncbi:putative membrane protein [Rhizobium alvei]